jgi:methylthioribose-1-phosphate isomerase
MNVNGQSWRTVWVPRESPHSVSIIDQRQLPWRFAIESLRTLDDVATAIRDMHVRGAGCIGATAAYGMWLAGETGEDLRAAAARLKATRPTAVNLAWAIDRMLERGCTRAEADAIAEEDIAACRAIGRHGLALIEAAAAAKKSDAAVNILTHCNAGWLAFVDIGSATAPVYAAQAAGIPIHVWVDETRPRNQGARLTAWELSEQSVPHTVIADSVGGHLMQRGKVDLVIIGADRVTRTGDAANKIGTYLKALAANDNGVPFHVALPSATLDWSARDGLAEIPIEERDSEETSWIDGPDSSGTHHTVRVTPAASPAANIAFDVTPARLITSLITERGICPASENGLLGLFPEKQ